MRPNVQKRADQKRGRRGRDGGPSHPAHPARSPQSPDFAGSGAWLRGGYDQGRRRPSERRTLDVLRPLPSKEDLLTAEIEDLRATLVAEQRAALARHGGVSARSLGFSRALFEHAQDYRDVYRALVGERGASIIIARMRGVIHAACSRGTVRTSAAVGAVRHAAQRPRFNSSSER